MPDPSYDALLALGWSERVQGLFADLSVEGAEPARVVRVERTSCVAATAGGDRLVSAPRLPAVGDWVALRGDAIADVLPRWSAVSRLDPAGGTVQVLAANVDLVMLTVPADRMRTARVERELVLAWDSGAQPLVVLTKADLAEPGAGAALARRLAGVDVVETSATTGKGIEELRLAVQAGRTAVLLGPSGAGKSSLANRLLGEDRLATAAVRDADRRGRHTTTSRQLVAVPTGGVLIDTPGLRSLALSGDGEGLGKAFSDIEELARRCRFADCAHRAEPGCAVEAALAGGDLDPRRFASYDKLERELAAQARRRDPLARKAQISASKALARSARAKSRSKRR